MNVWGEVYIGKGGVLDLLKRTYTHCFGVMEVPPAIFARGHGLFSKGLYNSPYEYVVRWCDYQLGANGDGQKAT